ncbi:13513_t:CDS:2 [Dentiscutata erythropus]|uniref:13513_t:CDS:1 n=1 Tax=Dentiscutata erythropus TaxID=1348616 RepID=A0A9N8VAR3_9GLOM|nr:13513_t:CDS:2 [Dentiscutata erythropus]
MTERLPNFASIFQLFFKSSPSSPSKEDQILTNLLEKCDRGFKFDENKSIISAPYKAIKIKTDKNELIELRLINNETSFVKECKHELDIFCNKNLILGGKIKVGLPWLSIFFGISHDKVKQKLKKFEKSIKYSQEIWERAEVIFSKSCIVPTDDLIKDVNDALRENTTKKKIDALREISEKYGSFYACRLMFGKAIVKVVKHAESTDKSSNTSSIEVQGEVKPTEMASMDINSTYRTHNESRSFDSYSTSDTKKIGDLENYTTWDIIGYDEIKLIFDLLDDSLREKVLDTLGHRILSSNFICLESNFENSEPYTYRLGTPQTKIEDIRECQIFASIMNNNEEDTFSLRVNYIDEYTPEIVVHLIPRESKNRLISKFRKSKYHRFKLSWVVVGQPKDFDFDMADYPIILRSYKYSNFNKEDDFIKISFSDIPKFREEIQKFHETCILSTCVLESSTGNNNYPFEASIVIGTHLSLLNYSACLYTYNLSDNNHIDENILQRRSLHICAVDVDFSYEISGQKKLKWNKNVSDEEIFPENGKKNAKNNEREEILILINQILNCSEGCVYHGSINIYLEKIIYGPFNSRGMDCVGGIAYLKIKPNGH